MKKRVEQRISEWSEFIQETLGADFSVREIVVDTEHKHRHLPSYWHLYTFWLNDTHQALKIGLAGPNSGPRYDYQHYSAGSANSNLAKSLIKDNVCIASAKQWTITNTYRINVVYEGFTKPLAHALESYLQLAFEPRYEK